jgi:hypothetical protein
MNGTMDDLRTFDAEAVNALLRNELAAVEVYTQALALFGDDALIAELQRIRAEHRRAVCHLRDHLVDLGTRPADGGGVWGAFGSESAGAKAHGPATVLAMLRQGEENGITEYEAVLEGAELHPDCLRAIQADLLPACRRHVEELNRLLGGSGL